MPKKTGEEKIPSIEVADRKAVKQIEAYLAEGKKYHGGMNLRFFPTVSNVQLHDEALFSTLSKN